MKLLIVTPIFPSEIGGPATYSQELLNRLAPEIEVEVVSFAHKPTATNRNIHLVSTYGGTITRQSKLFWNCLKYGLRADIFYLQEPAVVGLAGLVAGEILGKKILTKYVGDPSWEEDQRRGKTGQTLETYLEQTKKKRSFIYRVTKVVLKSSDQVITPAQHLKALLEKVYSIPSEKIKVIPNSVEKIEKKINKSKNSLIFVGRLVPWKNVDKIITAVSNLPEDIKWTLSIVGTGPEEEKLRTLTQKFGAGKKVHFFGNLSLEETKRQIAASEILILFSDYEGLSHAILEAMSAGTLVIASNISGNAEIITDNENGYLVNPGHTNNLTKVLAQGLTNTKSYKSLTEKAKKSVTMKYNWDVNLKSLKRVFQTILHDNDSV